MTTLLEKINDLNQMVLQGKTLEAFEKYYHPNVEMQENEEAPTVGKAANRKREEDFSSSLIALRSAQVTKVTVGENISMVEWFYDFTHKEWGERKYSQVSVQEWKDGMIIREKFYYHA